MPMGSSSRQSCVVGSAFLAALALVSPGFAQPSDIAASSAAGNANREVIQTDFALHIDGEFVVGTSGLESVERHGEATASDWRGEFSTHQLSARGAGAADGVHLVNDVGEIFTVNARRGDESYEIDGNSIPLANGLIEFHSILKHNSVVVGQQRAQLREGEKGSVAFGAVPGHTIVFDLTQRRLDAMLPPSQSLPPNPASAAGSHTKPAEKLASRRMKPPRYPPAAVRAGLQGEVQVNVLVDPQGSPYSVEVFGIEPPTAVELGGAALAAALQWRYEPATRDGKPVREALLVPVKFSLHADKGEVLPTPDPLRSVGVNYRKLTPPIYPADALQNQIAGTVYIRLQLDSDGVASAARVEKIVPDTATELGEAALQAVKNWQFSPQLQAGQAVASEARIPIEFKLSDAPSAAAAMPAGESGKPQVLEPVANSLQTIVVLPPAPP